VGVGVERWRRGEVAVRKPPHLALPRPLRVHDALMILAEGVPHRGGIGDLLDLLPPPPTHTRTRMAW
jgi:hypothetical protein